MLILYPDTNAFHADLLILRPTSRKLINALLPGQVEVALSPVVIAEAERQAREFGQDTVRALQAPLRDLPRKYGNHVPTDDYVATVDALSTYVLQASSRALGPLLEHSACHVRPWPLTSSEELVRRELERRAPTSLKGAQTVGLRDTIIWHGLVDLMQTLSDDDEVLFICADGGFLSDGNLAPSLVEELEQHWVDPGQLRVVDRLEKAIAEVEERRDLLTRQERIAIQAVIDHLADFEGKTWAYVDASNEAPMKYGVQEGLVVAVDSINIERTVGVPPETVEATAEITISGFMRTDEYLQEYSDAVEWMQGEYSDPMIGVDFTSTVALEAEVTITPGGDDAWIEDETLRWVE
ncbi:PIN domain-containing protein [Microbacterium sp. M4A5_1d]